MTTKTFYLQQTNDALRNDDDDAFSGCVKKTWAKDVDNVTLIYLTTAGTWQCLCKYTHTHATTKNNLQISLA